MEAFIQQVFPSGIFGLATSKQRWQHGYYPQQASRKNWSWTQKLRSQHHDYLTTGCVVSRRFFTYWASRNYVVCPLSECYLASFQLLFSYSPCSLFVIYGEWARRTKIPSVLVLQQRTNFLYFFSVQMMPDYSINGIMKVRQRKQTPTQTQAIVDRLSAIFNGRCQNLENGSANYQNIKYQYYIVV